MDKPILTNFVQAAIAMLYDLGLDRPPATDNSLQLAYRLKGKGLPIRFGETPSMEERRVLERRGEQRRVLERRV